MDNKEVGIISIAAVIVIISLLIFASHINNNITIQEMVKGGADPIVAACSVGSISCNSCVKPIEKK